MTASSNGRAGLSRGRRLAALFVLLTATFVGSLMAPAGAATGKYVVRWSEPGDLRNHVVYAPSAPSSVDLPVLIWGEGGCIANGLAYQTFLTEIASHGILVIASGGPLQVGVTNVGSMERSLSWVKAQNEKSGGVYAGRLDPQRVAVAGHSCGGLEAYELAAKRSEVAAVGIMNSGQLSQNQAQLDKQKAPILYVLGGSGDVAYANGIRDFGRLPAALPAFLASSGTGHFGTYFNANGGSYAQILKDWVKWRIDGDTTAAKRFVGTSCLLCTASGWTVKKRNID